MKKFISIIIILFTALMINTSAQTATDNLTVVDFQNSISYVWRGVDIDSAETIWSQWFKLADYDGFNTTTEIIGTTTITALDTVGGDGDTLIVSSNSYASVVKPQIGYKLTLDAGANDTALVSVYHFVNYVHPDSLSDWIVADTLKAITAETAGKAEVDLNNVKAPYHKLKAVNAATGAAGKLNFGIYFAKKE